MIDVLPTDLLGHWSLRRRLADRRAGAIGRVTGTLDLTLDGDRIRWFERGVLDWGGRAFEVHRELRIVPEDEGNWTVCFSDGRPFHPWNPGRAVEHPCRADLYRGLVAVDRGQTRLRVHWDVSGPAKDQRIISRCHRL